jgi:hypothetical protein
MAIYHSSDIEALSPEWLKHSLPENMPPALIRLDKSEFGVQFQDA